LLPTYARFGEPTMETIPAIDETLMIDPPPAFCIEGMTHFIP
jgi:hypothetical protein